MKQTLYITIFLFLHRHADAENVFYWKWQLTQHVIKITGRLNAGKEMVIFAESEITRRRYSQLYTIIDELEYKKLPVYLKIADTLSNQLVKPFAADIDKCDLIIVEIDSSLLALPVEFLNLKNKPLALVHPMVFTINGVFTGLHSNTLTLHKGYIIRDATADPENACADIFHTYPASEFVSARRITTRDLTRRRDIDFILVSAHGFVSGADGEGSIGLNRIGQVAPDFFKDNDPSLVYIDGCQQGINWAYISALTKTKKTNYYLGPIISNDSGESSTKTIDWFFEYLKQTHNPVMSMWKTRVRLAQYYYKRAGRMDAINKSLIFRIYTI